MLKRLTSRSILTIAGLVIAAAVIGGLVWRHHHQTATNTAGGGSSTALTPAHASKPKSNSSSNLAQGGAVDTHGSGVATSPTSSSTSSESGLITVYTPSSGGTLRPGDTISGVAKVSTVRYRLVDDSVGVLAQGSLSVVKGKFSGVIEFQPRSSSGQLDVFSYSSAGAEINSIKVDIKLSSS